ncbi:outer membrane protein assembly factor BamB [Gracilibacillus halotolerans]|uniref:Outer membrane protein assembly factor BamB n=1 Tax=Gracilibacillus halotolerans TaxID=74386 RepID=A0A841RN19_9BACI|nr:PQQ-binding-like beta-propeller repeat protein [Gracilibacillus halotolerans]MBB6513257.1 outer membrane protein assembly factor BamB [Gracilibacillus halotolerans]
MKKFVFCFTIILLFLSACSQNEDEQAVNEEIEESPTEEVVAEEENSEEELEEEKDIPTNYLTDVEAIPISEYPTENWTKAEFPDDRDYKMVHNAFIENDTYYIGSDSKKAISYNADHSSNWALEHKYGFEIELAMDDQHLYSHTIGSSDNYNYLRAIDKQSGNVNYEIDLTGYEEFSEVFSDDGVLYMIFGKMSDEDQIFADLFSLHAYDATNGDERWSLDIDALQLGKRNGHYEITSNEKMIFYFEKDYKLVARSKEDGSEVWSQPFDERLRFVQAFIHNDSLYVLDKDYVFHKINMETGEIIDEIPYDGEAMGPEIAEPIFVDNHIIMQHNDVEIDQHLIKGLDTETKDIAWIVDLDGYFAFGVEELNGTVYALLGDLNFEAENPTRVAKINPENGEIIEVIELEDYVTPGKVNTYNRFSGHTVHNGVLSISKNNILYGFY